MPDTQQENGSEAERLRLFLSSIKDYAIYMLSPAGTVISWNAGAERFKGYKSAEIVGRHFSRFYTEEDRASDLPARALRTAAETGKFEAEGWRVRKDGRRFWASVVIDPIRDASGTLIGYAKITRDISEAKAAREQLRASEERFRMLVQGVTDYAIYMLSPEGNITNWNEGARRIKGYVEDEVVGTHFRRFYLDEEQALGLPERALRRARENGRYEAEGWRIRKGGQRFWAHVIIDPIRNDMEELVGFAKVTRDITERRQAAAQLDQAKEALHQSQKLEALGKLTGGVAHDFNNLLGVLSNGAYVLRARLKDPADFKLLSMMEQAIARGALLTQQLLSFARQQPLKSTLHDINAVIHGFEAVLNRGSRHDINFQLNLGSSMKVMLDSAQFETSLLNLIVNARDATSDGGSIEISTQTVQLDAGQVKQLPRGRYVQVTVRDSGVGMSAEVAQRATEPFFTTKELGKGTGLGLSQVLGMVQQSGGDLTIVSAPSAGTSVHLFFPVSAEEDAGEVKTGPDMVLVVDDQTDVLETTAELCRTIGFEVATANSGEEAMQILRRLPKTPLLLTDMAMPGMNGMELARHARKFAPQIKVILASGYSTALATGTEEQVEGLQFLRKPYGVAELIRSLRSAG